jgi:hypothetical protein
VSAQEYDWAFQSRYVPLVGAQGMKNVRVSSSQARNQEVEGDFVGTANQSEQALMLVENLSLRHYYHQSESLVDEGAMANEKTCRVRVHLRALRIVKTPTSVFRLVRLRQEARTKTVRWAVPLKVHSLVVSRLADLIQESVGREIWIRRGSETQLAYEHECETASAVANPSYARVHAWHLPLHCSARPVGRGRMHVTSSQKAARIGWRRAGGVGSALVRGHVCRGHSSGCFESAGAEGMFQEVMA